MSQQIEDVHAVAVWETLCFCDWAERHHLDDPEVLAETRPIRDHLQALIEIYRERRNARHPNATDR